MNNFYNFVIFFQSHTELLPADMFLERCPLPRVVRISSQFSDETIQSSSSNGSGSSGVKKDSIIKNKQNGELCLLFRHLKNRKIYHGLSMKNGSARKKGVMIPQEFPGEFHSFRLFLFVFRGIFIRSHKCPKIG